MIEIPFYRGLECQTQAWRAGKYPHVMVVLVEVFLHARLLHRSEISGAA